ncbi:MAG: competence/damage-inducible protein A [Candidatus Omnitrophota bacterium]|jgi:nicotinamide-nucleotide amidase|nr:MAG: competence/damage-inducible protein A [Candidatus Omnitrophota bacterium]
MTKDKRSPVSDYMIIASGNELLSGKRQDRHIHFLTTELSAIGLNCRRCCIVGDEYDYLVKTIKKTLSEVKLVIITGGLGPTIDDRTRDAVSQATGIALDEHPDALEMLEERFRTFGRSMTENNRQQALVPVYGTFFSNPNGTAPGLVFDHGDKIVIALPGPPRELEPMVKMNLVPFLQGRLKLQRSVSQKILSFCCLGESHIDQVLRVKIGAIDDLEISSLSQVGTVTITLTLPDDTKQSQERLDQYVQCIKHEIGEYIFAEDDASLETVVGMILMEKHETIATAESCTGGLLGAKCTSSPGSSNYFLGGIISYDNNIKEKILGVKKETLDRFGAVSRQTACEMAQNVCCQFDSDWGIAITGIAGPSGGTEEKPVGSVWIAAAQKNGPVFPFLIHASGDRIAVRERSCIFALDQLRRLLLHLPRHQ